MNFDILNSKPLEFFSESGELMGKIFISGSTGDLFIAPVSGTNGDVILGDRNTVGDVEIGLPSAEVNLKLMGGGTISANGNTLTIGDVAAGDSVIVNGPITASNILSASYALTASHALNSSGGGSGIFEATGSIFATTNVLEVTGSMTLINTASNSTSSNTLSIEGSGSVSGSGIFGVRGSVGQLFEVQDGLDGVLMSVNDISGIPILTVSSSGDVILAEGSTLQGTAATASFVAGISAAFPFAGAGVITGSLDITGSGDDIFKVTSASGSLFSVDDGLDGILMSVNDISGLPLFEISSSGDVEIVDGDISGSIASTASFGKIFVNGTDVSSSLGGGAGGSTDISALNAFTGSANTSITALNSVTSSFMTSSATGSFNNLIITNFSGSSVPGDGSTISYTVTVVNSGGDKFAIDLGGGASTTPAFSLLAGNTYRFTQDDGTNSGHPFGFANFSDDSAYTDGVTYNGTAGQAGSYAQIVVTNSTPKLKYRCTLHGVTMGGDAAVTITTGSLIQNGFLEVSGSTRLSSSNSDVALTVEGSGSTLFEVIGSEGTIFSLDDELDGTLFTVNDRSGIPQFEVSASGLVEVGEGPLKLKGNNIQDESFIWFMA